MGVIVLCGCTLSTSESEGLPVVSGSSGDSATPSSTGSSTPAGSSSASSSSSTTGSAPKLDVGSLDTDADLGCSAVDFLFVVDSSQSMREHQANLVENFPEFISGIQSTLDNVASYHVGVVATSGYEFNQVGCQELGALITQTGGNNSSATVCAPFASGANYMTEADDLAAKFACAAQVGTLGSGVETPLDAIESAVDGSLEGPGQCNEGFLRDDALLVIVIITDEAGEDSRLLAGHYVDVVREAKLGQMDNAVVVAFLEPSAFNIRLRAFAEAFIPNGFIGDVSEDYGASFDEAIGVVRVACQNFAG